ncbi:hypothetical protein CFOL_v3_30745 [Cephalotus follicularis]|uniref:Uncharacterized protein n=1 Tax=Cephalotus follicularis TaxID=3775 RepID=A0A1Q3D4D3_CEPFO|nr:hypothetical protein CFOL_v3_30745 [Cephalotus follicularis]
MVSVGSKALRSSRPRNHHFVEEDNLIGEDRSYNLGKKKKGMGRKSRNKSLGFDGGFNKNVSGRSTDGIVKAKNFSNQSAFEPQASLVRKQVEPETVKYFSEIANLFETSGVDFEERSVICGNALEEARGKELELATDYIISHTLQTLLEGCDVDHLCGFLRSCSKVFPSIAMDRSGSHVVETALKALSMHLQDQETYIVIEETLTVICKVIVINQVGMMCNCYGSHVLRSLLCLCKGVPLDSLEFHGVKSSMILAERFNVKTSHLDGNDSKHFHQGFPDLLKFLVSGILKCNRKEIAAMQADQYSSLVLQATLKLLVGNDQELLQIIPILLGCNKENIVEGNSIEINVVHDIVELMKETAYSHLMEIILEVAPESLYNELFIKVFKNSLFELSSHHCGNFVVQALVSHSRNQDQMELIWKELGPKFKELLEMGRSGVIASLIAASQRLHTHAHECCQALADAICLMNDSQRCIVPRILFLDSYFGFGDKSNWNWPSGARMHVMGSLILQTIFRFQSEFIQPYITSITTMEADQVFEAAKDAGGARVIEAFLSSNASLKLKRRVITKLHGHFGDLAMNSSGSFTVEKCFTAGNLSLREAIASELLAARAELSKTKQGPYLLRKLDIDGFATQPDQWRSKQTSKQSAYKDFYSAFGSGEAESFKKDTFLTENSKHASPPNELKNKRKEIDDCHSAAAQCIDKYAKHAIVDDDMMTKENKKLGKRKNSVRSENANASGKATENAVKTPFLSFDMSGKKRWRKDRPSMASKKKF